MNELTVTLVQMDCLLGRPEQNFDRAAHWVSAAAARGSHLVVLPELWSTAYDLENGEAHAAPLAQNADRPGWFGRFAGLAREHRVWLTGSLLEVYDGRLFNCMVFYSPQGELVAAYRKVHLVPMLAEEQYLAPGQSLACPELPWGKTGMAICYDLRFPEQFRRYGLEGARMVVVPAEWPHPRRSHWQTLLRARAVENQCFVAACNRVGTSKEVNFCGASAVINPWGDILVEGGENEVLLTATLDLSMADEVRRRIPVFADRRADLYG